MNPITTAVSAWWRRRSLIRDTELALGQLDARTLRDLGLDRSEVASVAAEAAGIAERHRLSRYVPYY
jgi:uncharacterized protein YjiS (DUF1127 family)